MQGADLDQLRHMFKNNTLSLFKRDIGYLVNHYGFSYKERSRGDIHSVHLFTEYISDNEYVNKLIVANENHKLLDYIYNKESGVKQDTEMFPNYWNE